MRSTIEVFEDHLQRRSRGDIEGDLDCNYAGDVVLLCEHGALKGRAAVRNSAKALADQLPDARFDFSLKQTNGEHAALERPIRKRERRSWCRHIRNPGRTHCPPNRFLPTEKVSRDKGVKARERHSARHVYIKPRDRPIIGVWPCRSATPPRRDRRLTETCAIGPAHRLLLIFR
jgi:hypothetical protein